MQETHGVLNSELAEKDFEVVWPQSNAQGSDSDAVVSRGLPIRRKSRLFETMVETSM
ncbi:uncharacterized protein BJ212DRAFT_1322033 [Suillus subaureus]|uniref:Uncharacterized protein n=1 Tax=Suillus subaureus TaxID=48587 RepID=A0A9P7ELJ3_9AGAM|nr:uncharacterized protein BJ212DRAFT_1322033 [Suillus subaureus]KAG1824717.1 hypothetical protein BJ212DRAFT_1322033 [Suillus subaureus]